MAFENDVEVISINIKLYEKCSKFINSVSIIRDYHMEFWLSPAVSTRIHLLNLSAW